LLPNVKNTGVSGKFFSNSFSTSSWVCFNNLKLGFSIAVSSSSLSMAILCLTRSPAMRMKLTGSSLFYWINSFIMASASALGVSQPILPSIAASL